MTITGTRKAHAVYVVKDGGTGASSVTITNASTGETVVWANALAPSNWLRLSSDGQGAEISADSGSNWTASNGGMTGIIPMVQGGEDNAITVTGVTGTCSVSYTPLG